jgi:hypothetical protein
MKNSKRTNDNRSIPMVDRLSAQAAAVVRGAMAGDSRRASA